MSRYLLPVFFFLFSSLQATSSERIPAAPAATAPVRFVSLAPHLAELVYAAGADAGLVGVVKYSDYPQGAEKLPLVGDAFRVDYERIVQLAPDVVLTWGSGTPASISRYLRAQGFQVVELEPLVLADIPSQIEQIGTLAGTESVARATADNLRSQTRALREQYSQRDLVRVFLQISADPWITVTAKHILNDALQICGGDNVFADIAGVAPTISFESIIEANPDAIIAVTFSPEDDWQSDWSKWSRLTAVAENHLYTVDANLVSRAGPRMIAGTAQICEALESARVH